MFSRRLLIVAVIAVFSSAAQAPADWTATESLPDTYYIHSMAHAQGYLYHVGGFSGTNGVFDGDKVFYAQVTGPGTICPWVKGPALPALSTLHASVAWGDKLYVLGGQHWEAGFVLTSDVYFTQIRNGGVPGAWQTTTSLPETMASHGAVVWNGRLYILGGATQSGYSTRVYSAEINPDGTLSAWVQLEDLPVALRSSAVVQDGAIYVPGGVINNGIHNVVYMALIQGDGTISPWVTTTSLPEPLSDHEAVAIGGRVYVLGGWTGAAPTAAVRSAEILPDKTLGAWQSEPFLPVPLNLHASASDGEAIFSSGGLAPGDTPQSAVYGLPVALSPADITGPGGVPDGCVDSFDLNTVLAAWCSPLTDPDPPGDVDPPCEGCVSPDFLLADISGPLNAPDGCVDSFDLNTVLAAWCSALGGNPCGTCGP